MHKNNYSLMDIQELDERFNSIADEYAKRLCEMYGWYFEDCFWVVDDRSGTFCVSDIEYSLSLENIRLLVQKNVPFEEFQEWWDYNMLIHYAQVNHAKEEHDFHEINLFAWLKGYRSKYTIEDLKTEEDFYWKKF